MSKQCEFCIRANPSAEISHFFGSYSAIPVVNEYIPLLSVTWETWKEVVMDLHFKPSDAMDRRKQRETVRGNWDDSNGNSDAVS